MRGFNNENSQHQEAIKRLKELRILQYSCSLGKRRKSNIDIRQLLHKPIKKSTRNILLTLFILYIFSTTDFISGIYELTKSETSSAITEAEEAINLAFEAILDAERAGANVSNLLTKFSETSELLAQMKISYRIDDFDPAMNYYAQCIQAAEEIQIEANKLESIAEEQNVQRMEMSLINSCIGTGIIVGASFLCWRLFRIRYIRRILKMKPRVFSGEA